MSRPDVVLLLANTQLEPVVKMMRGEPAGQICTLDGRPLTADELRLLAVATAEDLNAAASLVALEMDLLRDYVSRPTRLLELLRRYDMTATETVSEVLPRMTAEDHAIALDLLNTINDEGRLS